MRNIRVEWSVGVDSLVNSAVCSISAISRGQIDARQLSSIRMERNPLSTGTLLYQPENHQFSIQPSRSLRSNFLNRFASIQLNLPMLSSVFLSTSFGSSWGWGENFSRAEFSCKLNGDVFKMASMVAGEADICRRWMKRCQMPHVNSRMRGWGGIWSGFSLLPGLRVLWKWSIENHLRSEAIWQSRRVATSLQLHRESFNYKPTPSLFTFN